MMSAEKGNSEAPRWSNAVGILALLVPAGISVALAHETGFFGALGLRADYAFLALLPIPVEELLRIAFIVAIVAFASAVVMAAMLSFVGSIALGSAYLMGAASKYLRSGRGQDDALPRHDVFTAQPSRPWKFITSAKSPANILRLVWQAGQARFLGRMWTVILCVYLVLVTLLFVVIPGATLLMDFLSTEGVFLGIIAFLGFVACAFVLITSETANLLRGGRVQIKWPRRLTASLIAFALAALVAHSAGSKIGYAMLNPDKNSDFYPVAMSSSATARCPQAEGALLVRSYTNGSIYFRPGQLIWLWDSDRACSVIRLRTKKMEVLIVTPTLFSYPLEVFRFRAIREVD